ncbi:MAG: cation-transporting P-type ATPase, partial [Actinomycetota bacterium]
MRSSRSGPEPGDRAAAVPARADGSTPTPPWAEPSEHIASELRTDTGTGLRSADAAARLESDGPNLLAESPPPTLAQRFLAQFTDPLVGLLLAAIVVSLLAWWSDGADEAPVESIVIALIVVANAVIGVWQEGRAIDAVAALRQLTSVQSTVIRDGRSRTLPSEQLVVGDLIVLAEGDAVSADARLSETHDLEVSEAPLTGESLPVAKSVLQSSPDAPVADRTCMVHSGTAVTKGRARAIVTATGDRTEVGRIAELLGSAEVDRTPLQRQIDQLSR